MRTPHLLRIEAPPSTFAPIFEAARAAGLRVGWLEMSVPAPLPQDLETAAWLGALRAVGAGDGRMVAVKPMRGAPVLRDVLREQFKGCTLVLARGAVDAPLLIPEGRMWRLRYADGSIEALDTSELVSRLRRPRPFAR